MTDRKLAEAYRQLATAYNAVADELEGGGVDASRPADARAHLEPLPRPQVHVPPADDERPANSADMSRVCPIHGTEYRSGSYGPYCTSPGVEPWADRKGYCNMPGRNAANAIAWANAQAAQRVR